jgi:hypothetical protein
MTNECLNLSNRAADGGIQQPGPHGDKYASPNVIRFPAPTSLPDNLELPSGAPFLIPDDTCVICALAVVITSTAVAIGLLLFAGVEIFGLFDLG